MLNPTTDILSLSVAYAINFLTCLLVLKIGFPLFKKSPSIVVTTYYASASFCLLSHIFDYNIIRYIPIRQGWYGVSVFGWQTLNLDIVNRLFAVILIVVLFRYNGINLPLSAFLVFLAVSGITGQFLTVPSPYPIPYALFNSASVLGLYGIYSDILSGGPVSKKLL